MQGLLNFSAITLHFLKISLISCHIAAIQLYYINKLTGVGYKLQLMHFIFLYNYRTKCHNFPHHMQLCCQAWWIFLCIWNIQLNAKTTLPSEMSISRLAPNQYTRMTEPRSVLLLKGDGSKYLSKSQIRFYL